MTKVQDLETGDLVEWKGERRIIENVIVLRNGDVTVSYEYLDKNGYGVAEIARDTEITVLD